MTIFHDDNDDEYFILVLNCVVSCCFNNDNDEYNNIKNGMVRRYGMHKTNQLESFLISMYVY